MGLTQRKLKVLEEREYDKLYEKHRTAWLSYAKGAFGYAKDFIAGGHEPRADDVVHALLLALDADERLMKHQAVSETPREMQDEYREYFAEYVVEKYRQSRGETS